uniref:Uncharacterized protein n=1 Tax=Triticum urartu TaxID=4572 RepID=A0A8R7QBG6_TRIUA
GARRFHVLRGHHIVVYVTVGLDEKHTGCRGTRLAAIQGRGSGTWCPRETTTAVLDGLSRGRLVGEAGSLAHWSFARGARRPLGALVVAADEVELGRVENGTGCPSSSPRTRAEEGGQRERRLAAKQA